MNHSNIYIFLKQWALLETDVLARWASRASALGRTRPAELAYI
jgi:hypothetical protein